jgi:hypothetical protein
MKWDAKLSHFFHKCHLYRSYTKLYVRHPVCVTWVAVTCSLFTCHSILWAVSTLSHMVVCGYCKNIKTVVYVLLGKEDLSKFRKMYFYWKCKTCISASKGRSTSGKSVLYHLLVNPRIHHHHNSSQLDPTWACSTQFLCPHNLHPKKSSYSILMDKKVRI